MSTETISIAVDSDAARSLARVPAAERRKLELLLSLRLKELVGASHQPLSEVMDQMAADAKARGLTPEILESLLGDE